MKKVALLFIFMTVVIEAKVIKNYNPPKLPKSQIKKFLYLINKARSKYQDCGVYGVKPPAKPLKWNWQLYKAAYEHSVDMAMNNFLEHYGSNTKYDLTGKIYGVSNQILRAKAHGYKNNDYIGENILYGNYHFSLKEVVDSFIEHDEHCPNMMNPRFKDVAVAYYKNPKTGLEYWTLILGTHYVKRYYK